MLWSATLSWMFADDNLVSLPCLSHRSAEAGVPATPSGFGAGKLELGIFSGTGEGALVNAFQLASNNILAVVFKVPPLTPAPSPRVAQSTYYLL